MQIALSETNLTAAQWNLLQPLRPAPSQMGRPPTERRWVIEAILYIVKGGIPGRLLPTGFPPWQTVHSIFRKWTLDPTWESLNDCLRGRTRKQQGKRGRPTAAILDSQSVKSAGHGGRVGSDAAKQSQGRKRPRLVDTLGLVLGVLVTAAAGPERAGARSLRAGVLGWFTWWRRRWVDGGDSGPEFAAWVRTLRPKLEVEVVKRSDKVPGFKLLPRRWVVERTLGWLMRHRRRLRD